MQTGLRGISQEVGYSVIRGQVLFLWFGELARAELDGGDGCVRFP